MFPLILFQTDFFLCLTNFLLNGSTQNIHFLDEHIEAKRKAVLNYISKYLDYIAHNTWRLEGNPHYNSVPAEWEDGQPERYAKTIDTMQRLADEAVKSYEEMVMIGKAKLKI